MTYRDDVVIGMYAKLERSGLITFHIEYEMEDERRHLTLGALNEKRDDHVTIEQARKRANVVKVLAQSGINVQDGLHKRLLKELDKKGTAWRPE